MNGGYTVAPDIFSRARVRLKTRVFSDGKAEEALAASMAVPVLFKPVWSNGRPLIDGAVGDIAGVDGLERSERVLYHHVSRPLYRGRKCTRARLLHWVASTFVKAQCRIIVGGDRQIRQDYIEYHESSRKALVNPTPSS